MIQIIDVDSNKYKCAFCFNDAEKELTINRQHGFNSFLVCKNCLEKIKTEFKDLKI